MINVVDNVKLRNNSSLIFKVHKDYLNYHPPVMFKSSSVILHIYGVKSRCSPLTSTI